MVILQEKIAENVSSVLERTPLTVKPRKLPIDIDTENPANEFLPPPILPDIVTQSSSDFENHYQQNLQMQPINLLENSKSKLKLELIPCVQVDSETQNSTATISNLDEYLAPPSEFQNLSSLSPDDGQNSISRINYDIDFSDISGDNSIAEDLTPDPQKSPGFTPDPFSPLGSSCVIAQTPLVPMPPKENFVLPFLDESETILDKKTKTPLDELPSPIKPTTSEYTGFSKQGWQIPSIPCNTGDYNSLNLHQSEPIAHSSMTEPEHDDKDNKDQHKSSEKAINVLGDVLETFDKLF